MRYLLIIWLVSIALSSCAHAKFGIVKSYSFFETRYPGTIAVDDTGKSLTGPYTVYSAFLEVKSGFKPNFSTAYINGKKYQVLTALAKSPLIVGTQHNSENKIVLRTNKETELWQITFEEPINAIQQGGKEQSKANAIIIQGIYKNQKVSYTLQNPVQLQAPLYM